MSGCEWTEAEDTFICGLWAQGQSAREISGKTPGRSRSSIIGRIHRLGMSGNRDVKPQKLKPRRRTPARAIFTKPKFAKVRHMEAPEPVASLNVALIDLKPDQCHAVTDPTRFEQRYCGHPVTAESCYCAHHAARFRIVTGKAR